MLAYVAFRRTIIRGAPAESTCLAGTMVQEVFDSMPALREACARSIFGHAATLEADIAAAMRARGIEGDRTAASLARHPQAVLQGAFILAKASGERSVALESVDHLERYIELLFGVPTARREGDRQPHQGRRPGTPRRTANENPRTSEVGE